MDRVARDEGLPGHLYQPVSSKNAPVLVVGRMAEARKRAMMKGITVPEALADFPPGNRVLQFEWTEIDGRRVAIRRCP